MIVSCEISPEELKVFMEEAEEHIQLLDEDLIKLENEGDNPELLQEIFRAAHTLKGSSAMLGHKRMAEVTHAMESLLDKLRQKKIAVNTRIIDALLFALDALKVLKNEVNSEDESDIDIPAIVNQLNGAAGDGLTINDAGGKHIRNPAKKEASTIALSKGAERKVAEAQKKGIPVYTVHVLIDPKSEWMAVRSLQVCKELATMGDLIDSNPSASDIEHEKVMPELVAVLSTKKKALEIEATLKLIPEIETVVTVPFGAETSMQSIQTDNNNSMGEAVELNGRQVTEQNQQQKPELKTLPASTKNEAMSSIRVDVGVLDNLMNMVEELVIDRSRISQVGRMLESKYPDDELVSDLGDTSNHIIKVINELYQDIMKVRMVPISLVFNKFPRLVRDLAQKQNKNIEFTIRGESTELDRTIIEKIQDPLIHLVRNAVDHGIETPDERKRKGKPERGLLKLEAYQEEGHIVIKIEDDGRGIDANKVRDSAVRKGFTSAEAAARMTDTEAIDMIFASGISTAEKTTDVSGRGVGLDIVRTNIERLNGNVTLDTRVNAGTSFTLKLPLTVAVFQGLVVTISGSSYIVPLVSVMETIKIRKEEIKTIRQKEVMTLRDSIVPLMRLGNMPGTKMELADRDEEYVLVVKAEDRVAGIVVDELKEQMEFVIKSLGKYLGELKGIAGATILGNGEVALILDIPTLIRVFVQKGHVAA